MNSALSYLQNTFITEKKMSATERKIGEAKLRISNAKESIKSREQEIKDFGKESSRGQKAQASIKHWEDLIKRNEDIMKQLAGNKDLYNDHNPEELEKRVKDDKAHKAHKENFSKMGDEDFKAHLDNYKQKLEGMSDEDRVNMKNDPEHKALVGEVKKRNLEKIQLKKAKKEIKQNVPQSVDTDHPDVERPTENPDHPTIPTPPASMTNDEDDVLSKVDTEKFTSEKEWNEHMKALEKAHGKNKDNFFAMNDADKGKKKNVSYEDFKKAEKEYDKSADVLKDASLKKSMWIASGKNKKQDDPKTEAKKEVPKEQPKEVPTKETPKVEPTKETPKETPVEEPTEKKSKYAKVDNDKDWDAVIKNVTSSRDTAQEAQKQAVDNPDLSDDERKAINDNAKKTQAAFDDAIEHHTLYKSKKKSEKPSDVSTDKKTEPTKETPSKEEPKDDKTKYTGSDKSHPLNFKSIDDFKTHHREKALEDDHPSEYNDAVKAVEPINNEIGELNDEMALNKKELADPKTPKNSKQKIVERNKEIQQNIKELNNSKKPHEKAINKHEEGLSKDFYDHHKKKKNLTDQLDNISSEYKKATAAGEHDHAKKLGVDFEEVHSQLKKHLSGEKLKDDSESPDDTTPVKPDSTDDEGDDIDSSSEVNGSFFDKARKSAEGEVDYDKKGPIKQAREAGNRLVNNLLDRLGRGITIDGDKLNDLVKDSRVTKYALEKVDKMNAKKREMFLASIKKPYEDHIKHLEDEIEKLQTRIEDLRPKAENDTVVAKQIRELEKTIRSYERQLRDAEDIHKEIIDKANEKNESFSYLLDKTSDIKIVTESEEVVYKKVDPSEYLKNILRG
jgi:conjugal transfer/entry exclusion protein